MKKVLIINYHFPPDAAIGAVRFAKFAKYLPEFGWEPVVYTVRESQYERCDYTKFENALNAFTIYRVKPIPGPLELYTRLGSRNHKGSRAAAYSKALDQGQSKTVPPKGLTLKRLVGSMLRVPDDKQGWILNIIKNGYGILKKHQIDVFLTSGPPMGTHLAGAVLKTLTGARWVADFRDPWWGSCLRMAPQFRTDLSDNLTKKLELLVVKKADLVISTAPALTEYFRSILPSDRSDKCVTITNGFDEDDFSGLSRQAIPINSPKIRICHAGSLYVGRNPEPFLAALRALVLRGDVDKERIDVEFIGDCSNYNGTSMAALVKKYDVASMVRLKGPMPHRACLERLLNADGLLLFAQDFAEQIPAKIFEYLRIDKPILAIITQGDAGAILQRSGNAFMADPHIPGQMEERFLEMLRAIEKKAEPDTAAEYFRQYDRRTLTRQLAEYLGQDGIDSRI